MAVLTISALLLILLSGVQSCNSGWYLFQGKCYKVSQVTYNPIEAQSFCQATQANLAKITSMDVLRFLTTVPSYNGMNEYWLRVGSSIHYSSTESQIQEITNPGSETENIQDQTTTSSPDLCPYVKVLDIQMEFCSEKKYFICESQYPNTSIQCPAGFDYYGKNCYRAITRSVANFANATTFCSLQHSTLAILDSEDKEYEAKAALLEKNSSFFVSAKKVNGVLEWTNKEKFSPIHILFSDNIEGDCLAIKPDAEHPVIFRWDHVSCDQGHSFLCMSPPSLQKEEVSTTTVPTTTVQTLEPSCPHGYNWKTHEDSGFCFWETTYEVDRLNWFQAREFCKHYGGDLASYDNKEQEDVGLGGARGHYKGLWIGLKRDENNVFHWIDGNILNFTNWATDEPNLKSNTKFCVAHASGSSKWSLDYCGVKRWFICKAPKAKNYGVPDLPSDKKTRCDIHSPSTYSSQWYEYENHCYLIQESSTYTWDTARLFCQDNGAHMLSVHSFQETDFILYTITGYPEGNFWIGLSAHGMENTFEWSDRSPLDFLYWSDTKSEIEDFNTCVAFNRRDGSWDVYHCNRLQGVICKRGKNASYDFDVTEPTTTMPGNCENGWYNLGNKCYKLFGAQWSQRLNWNYAKTECESMGASLVSIHNQNEQEFLTDIVLESYTSVWIGLRSLEAGTIFHWSDDSRMDYTNWNSKEPSAYYGDIDLMLGPSSIDLCVEMELGESYKGKWNAGLCTEKKAYMCQKMKDPTNTAPYIDPFSCPNITGWSQLGPACYGFFENHNMTWMEAQRECKKHSANLVSFRNAAVLVFVKRKLARKNVHYWIGVREKSQDKYEYVTGHALFYTNWMVDQPQAASSFLDNCVAITGEGDWLVKSCKEKHPFICKTVQDSEPEPEIDQSHSCTNASNDWKDLGGDSCYLVETDTKLTWVESLYYCFKHGGYLASFHSIDDIERVRKTLLQRLRRPTALHIGLGRKKDGTYSWVDKSPVDFVNWDDNEPDTPDLKECVQMDTLSGKWNDIECDDYRGFICSAPKIHADSFEESPFTGEDSDGTSGKEDIEHKLTVGGIFGILICILVVIAIIGVTVYYLRPKKEVVPRLLEQDNL